MKDAEFMTAHEKEMVLKQWKTFVKHGFKWSHFTNRLYNHLIMHCSFIAHYSRSGFYSVYFGANRASTVRFIGQFCGGLSVEYGYNIWKQGDYEDLNDAMIDVMKPAAKRLIKDLEHAAKEDELGRARAIFEKYGEVA